MTFETRSLKNYYLIFLLFVNVLLVTSSGNPTSLVLGFQRDHDICYGMKCDIGSYCEIFNVVLVVVAKQIAKSEKMGRCSLYFGVLGYDIFKFDGNHMHRPHLHTSTKHLYLYLINYS